jgi:putative ABC transport system permease protein
MLTHYLLVAARNLGRHRFGTLVSVAGLACFIGARMFAAYVDRADGHFPNAERIFAVYQSSTWAGLGLDVPMDGTAVTPLIAERLRIEYPELEAVARSRIEPRAVVTADGQRRFERVRYVDPPFLRIFPLTFVHGAAGDVESLARGVILTERAAVSLFGTIDVSGRSLGIEPLGDVAIAGVVEPIADPSHLAGTFDGDGGIGIFVVTRVEQDVAGAPLFADAAPENTPPPAVQTTFEWLGFGGTVQTYLLLPEDRSLTAAELNAAFSDIVARHAAVDDASIAFEVRHVSRLLGESLGDWLVLFTDFSLTTLLQALGALVLVTACLNFVNLATVRAAGRGKEVGLRKALGARRGQLAAQHLSEGVLVAALAVGIALVFVEAATRVLNDTAGWNLPSLAEAGGTFWLFVAALTVAVGAAGGLYPALVLARVAPFAALRGGSLPISAGALRSTLIGAQFAAASFLLIVVTVVAAQNRELARSGPSPGSDLIVVITASLGDARIDAEEFRARLEASPLIVAVTGAEVPPWEGQVGGTGFARRPDDPGAFVFTQTQRVSYDYFSTLGTKVLAGRVFSRERGDGGESAETGRVVIDRLAAERFGWTNPRDAIGQALYRAGFGSAPAQPSTIIGVVEHAPPRVFGWGSRAFIYTPDPQGITHPIIRLSPHDVPAGLAHIDAVWHALAPDAPISREFLDERFARAYGLFRSVIAAFALLATIAFAIAVMGLLGMTLFVVARRRHEIGVRKVLGASTPRILKLLTWQLVRPVLIANVAVWPLAFFAARFYVEMFMRPAPLTPLPFLLSLGITLLVTCAVVGRQALSSALTKPATVLRHE